MLSIRITMFLISYLINYRQNDVNNNFRIVSCNRFRYSVVMKAIKTPNQHRQNAWRNIGEPFYAHINGRIGMHDFLGLSVELFMLPVASTAHSIVKFLEVRDDEEYIKWSGILLAIPLLHYSSQRFLDHVAALVAVGLR